MHSVVLDHEEPSTYLHCSSETPVGQKKEQKCSCFMSATSVATRTSYS